MIWWGLKLLQDLKLNIDAANFVGYLLRAVTKLKKFLRVKISIPFPAPDELFFGSRHISESSFEHEVRVLDSDYSCLCSTENRKYPQ